MVFSSGARDDPDYPALSTASLLQRTTHELESRGNSEYFIHVQSDGNSFAESCPTSQRCRSFWLKGRGYWDHILYPSELWNQPWNYFRFLFLYSCLVAWIFLTPPTDITNRLHVNVIPFVVLLIIPTLGAMSDHSEQVRLMAAQCFATLISLMPLEVGYGLSEEIREFARVDER